jgi:hypothetical protein
MTNLPAGGTCTFNVIFTADAVADFTGTITVQAGRQSGS